MQKNIFDDHLYKILFNAIPEAVIIINLKSYEIIDANPKALELFGYSLDELSYLKITDLLLNYNKNIEKKNYKTQIYCKKKDNSEFPTEITITKLLYDKKELGVLNIKDITKELQKEKIEEDLKISEKRYKAILDNLQEGFYQTDKDYKIVFISQSALKILGYTEKSEVLGTPIKDYLLEPNDIKNLLSRLENAGGKLYNEEIKIVNKNKDILLISLNVQLVLDEDGNYSGLQGTFRDITEFKRRWNEIIKLYHMVEGLQNALILMELDGTIIYANKASLDVAHSSECTTIKDHVLGKKIKKFISFDQSVTHESVWETIIKTGKWFGSAYISCGNKERVPIDVMFSKIQNGDEKCYIVASAYDVSEYRKLEEKIKEQSRLYEELSKSMQELVEQMTFVNKKSYKRLSVLEEAFEKSTAGFLNHSKGGYQINAS